MAARSARLSGGDAYGVRVDGDVESRQEAQSQQAVGVKGSRTVGLDHDRHSGRFERAQLNGRCAAELAVGDAVCGENVDGSAFVEVDAGFPGKTVFQDDET